MTTTLGTPTRSRSFAVLRLVATGLLLAACSATPAGPGATAVPAGTGAPGGTAGSGATAGPGGGPGGGTAGPAQSIAGTAACDVLTADSIASIAGATLVNAVPASQLGIFDNGCLYELRDEATGATTTINLGLMATGGRQYYDTELAPVSGSSGYTPIDGLGEVAVNAQAGAVIALAGDVLLSVQYFGPSGPDRQVAIEVARQVFANLGA